MLSKVLENIRQIVFQEPQFFRDSGKYHKFKNCFATFSQFVTIGKEKLNICFVIVLSVYFSNLWHFK